MLRTYCCLLIGGHESIMLEEVKESALYEYKIQRDDEGVLCHESLKSQKATRYDRVRTSCGVPLQPRMCVLGWVQPAVRVLLYVTGVYHAIFRFDLNISQHGTCS